MIGDICSTWVQGWGCRLYGIDTDWPEHSLRATLRAAGLNPDTPTIVATAQGSQIQSQSRADIERIQLVLVRAEDDID